MSNVYSFRAPAGFVPVGMNTGVYVRQLAEGGVMNGKSGAFTFLVGAITGVVLVLPIVMLVYAMMEQNRRLVKVEK